MRKQTRVLAAAIVTGVAMLLATAGSSAQADHDDLSLRVRLTGYQEDSQ